MKQKFGIKKTKMNIFWLLVIGLIIGAVVGLRQPVPQSQNMVTTPQQQGAQK